MMQIKMARSVTMAGAVKFADSAQLLAQLANVLMECTSLSHALSSLELHVQQPAGQSRVRRQETARIARDSCVFKHGDGACMLIAFCCG
jgi:hypothetical protein